EGRNIVLSAPTASGKTECYLVPVIDSALHGHRSLLVFPTKALSQDQLGRFLEFSMLGVSTAVYDGDTPESERKRIRANPPHVLITNFDMLHHMLLNNRLFKAFFQNLRYVVVDELHYYSGTLGSHASAIIFRLGRVASKHAHGATDPASKGGARQLRTGADACLPAVVPDGVVVPCGSKGLRFICTSATIKNPAEFAESICGVDFETVSSVGAPSGSVEHYFARVSEKSYVSSALSIAKKLNARFLIFGNSHSVVERLGLLSKSSGFPLEVYRGGLDYSRRRQIEMDFKAGRIRGLAATSALELGMDIGNVDAVILAGFPGTISRLRQRIGRAGRRSKKAVSVFIPRDNPLDHYYYDNQAEYLFGEPESCHSNVQNERVMAMHIPCAARDFPLSEKEPMPAWWKKGVASLLGSGALVKWGGYAIPSAPAVRKMSSQSIRSIGRNVPIIDMEKNKEIGSRPYAMACKELFVGAIYLSEGCQYESVTFDSEKPRAYVRKLPGFEPIFTQAMVSKDISDESAFKSREIGAVKINFGSVHVSEEIEAYATKDMYSLATKSTSYLENPILNEFGTNAIWFDIGASLAEREKMTFEMFGYGLHGAEHLLINMLGIVCYCEPNEIGGLSMPSGRVYMYEGAEGGSGVLEAAYNDFEKVAAAALERITKCPCSEGCPKCVLDHMCGNNNRHLSKKGAAAILAYLVSQSAGKKKQEGR
ncbi:MAG TPA: DEAD/DEAH box helicase, partial [Candidatus Micrarchaeota archaeon]|nr:DEAD/DEAH box helicase [Candidatus Micrarchaeota archaeon]